MIFFQTTINTQRDAQNFTSYKWKSKSSFRPKFFWQIPIHESVRVFWKSPKKIKKDIFEKELCNRENKLFISIEIDAEDSVTFV